MGKTSIEWTDETWNPTRGCSRVSEGCQNCYAEKIAGRFSGAGQRFEGFARRKHVAGIPNDPKCPTTSKGLWTGRVELIPEKLDEPLHWWKPRRVFVNGMSDLFHEALPDEAIDRVFAVMALAPRHTFQVLTKRPERMRSYVSDSDRLGKIDFANRSEWALDKHTRVLLNDSWPLKNVWLGVSVEDQATADERIPLLLQTPAAVRFVSYEPALGPVDFRRLPGDGDERYINALTGERGWTMQHVAVRPESGPRLDWIIVGSESGPGARPFDVAWARSAVWQCREPGTACFIKQLGARRGSCPVCGHPDEAHGIGRTVGCQAGDGSEQSPICGCRKMRGEIDHRMGDSYARHAPRDRKGGDWLEWPEDLRVREFPEVTHA